MIKWRRPGRLLQIACALPLLLGLAGCAGPSLEERIRTVQAQEHDTQLVEPRARPQTRVRDVRMRDVRVRDVRVRDARVRDALLRDGPVRDARVRGGVRTGRIGTVTRRDSHWQPVPAGHRRTPNVDSPEWVRKQAEAAEKDRQLNRKIRSICRGC
jgi:hypothetical protein